MSMEYLTRCLATLGNIFTFKFHPKCNRTKAISLLIADDMSVLRRRDLLSIAYVQDQIHIFSLASGLLANEENSTMYVAGLSSCDQEEIVGISKMPLGSFPFDIWGAIVS